MTDRFSPLKSVIHFWCKMIELSLAIRNSWVVLIQRLTHSRIDSCIVSLWNMVLSAYLCRFLYFSIASDFPVCRSIYWAAWGYTSAMIEMIYREGYAASRSVITDGMRSSYRGFWINLVSMWKRATLSHFAFCSSFCVFWSCIWARLEDSFCFSFFSLGVSALFHHTSLLSRLSSSRDIVWKY